MSSKAGKNEAGVKIVATNRKARFLYHIIETYEAGLQLVGCEVKSLRAGRCSLVDSYAMPRGNEIYLLDMYIPPYEKSGPWNPVERRDRKLLLHKQEIRKLSGAVSRKGHTIIPLRVYFNDKNKAKVEIAVAQGKKLYDKRENIKARDADRDMERGYKKR